jgi:hypothetical protein
VASLLDDQVPERSGYGIVRLERRIAHSGMTAEFIKTSGGANTSQGIIAGAVVIAFCYLAAGLV